MKCSKDDLFTGCTTYGIGVYFKPPYMVKFTMRSKTI